MALADHVQVSRRFQRAIRIDTDFRDPAALDGFVCPRSSAEVLETMAHHVLETGQGAFTWTGPYGGGKSSLAVVLGAMLNGSRDHRSRAAAMLDDRTTSLLYEALPPRSRGWRVLPVSGRRDRPAEVIGEAIETTRLVARARLPATWSEKTVLEALEGIAARNPRAGGGLVLLIDELGKFLEAAARDGTDIHLFQQLAELASRSRGRLIVVGILHQAFEEYAHSLSREARNEWSKIQGRFVDLPVNPTGDEQIDLLARAIRTDRTPRRARALARDVARLANGQASPHLADMLADCWPLHPITACLLGPLSRRRFGQNQRSLFGFLNSAEPCGFRDFTRRASDGDLYCADQLWDYLRINLEPSIIVSPDGHRWAQAADALGRCETMGGDGLQLKLLKVIALMDLLKERAGIPASREALELALPEYRSSDIGTALKFLQDRSLIVFRKFADAWAIFEGSDFDIDSAVGQALQDVDEVALNSLGRIASLQPIVAKRNYHDTGALRWFDVGVVPLAQLEQAAADYSPRNGAIGCFLLAMPTQGESESEAATLCRNAARSTRTLDILVGLSPGAWNIPRLARELAALERVRDDNPELQGDRVGRTEVLARITAVRERIESELMHAFDNASWHRKGEKPELLPRAKINGLASYLADNRFQKAPRLHNELLGRTKPSSNAIAARNALLRRMVLNENKERLGIDGFPAEGGLYFSLLGTTGLHRQTADGWGFCHPEDTSGRPPNLAPLWQAAADLLQSSADRVVAVAEIHDLWRSAPFGVKDGLLPVLSVAFLLSNRGKLAYYRQGVFQTGLTDLDTEYLSRDPADIQLRWMDLSDVSRSLLSNMAEVVRDLDENNELRCLEPIDVARGLVAIHDRLPPWVGRTQRLSSRARQVRQLFKQARDPNRLIFDDMPKLLAGGGEHDEGEEANVLARLVREGLVELSEAYPAMLARLQDTLLAELQVPNAAPAMLAELRGRAENIRDLGGDHRLEAFIMRLSRFGGSREDMEGLAGMAVNKPVHGWVDPDVDKAGLELADMAQRFVRAEAFAHVKGRRDKRHSVAVVIGLEGRPQTVHDEFHVTERERASVDSLVGRVDAVLQGSGEARRNVVLAALAELSARYLGEPAEPRTPERAELEDVST